MLNNENVFSFSPSVSYSLKRSLSGSKKEYVPIMLYTHPALATIWKNREPVPTEVNIWRIHRKYISEETMEKIKSNVDMRYINITEEFIEGIFKIGAKPSLTLSMIEDTHIFAQVTTIGYECIHAQIPTQDESVTAPTSYVSTNLYDDNLYLIVSYILSEFLGYDITLNNKEEE